MIIRLVNQAFKIKRLRAENRRLKAELEQKEITIQYLNGCINKANRRYINLLTASRIGVRAVQALDFPNSSVESSDQISISDILEN